MTPTCTCWSCQESFPLGQTVANGPGRLCNNCRYNLANPYRQPYFTLAPETQAIIRATADESFGTPEEPTP